MVGTLQLVGQALWGKEVLHAVGLQTIHLDEAFGKEPLEQKIDGTQGHADMLAQLALCGVGVAIYVAEDCQFFVGGGFCIHAFFNSCS